MASDQMSNRLKTKATTTGRKVRQQVRRIRRWLSDIENPGLLVRMGLVIGVLGLVYLFVLSFINGITLALVPGDFPARGSVATLLAIGITALFGVLQYIGGKWAALEAVDAQELTESDAPGIHETVMSLSDEMGIEKPALYTAELGAPNAFAVGRQSDGAVVLGTELLHFLEADEVDGVIAHELAHLKHRDSVFMTLAASIHQLSVLIATAVTTLTIMVTAFMVEAIVSSMGKTNRGTGTNWGAVTALFVSVISTIVAVFVLIFSNALSRYREYIADTTAAKAIGDSSGLESGLEKIEQLHKRRDVEQHEAVTALCIFGDRESAIVNLFATHPSMKSRIQNLQSIDMSE